MYSANQGQNNAVGANMFRLKNWYLGNSVVPCETPSIAGDDCLSLRFWRFDDLSAWTFQPTLGAAPMTDAPLVLVIEDETMIAMMVEDELKDAGYRVAGPFATCSGASSWLSTNTADLAVLDTRLQDGSCRDLALALKDRRVPFVVYSGAIDTNMTELEGAPWVSKPAPGTALLDALRQITTWHQDAA
jgi:CheY-like chemotaxis protein